MVSPVDYAAAIAALGHDGVRRNQLTTIFGGTATDLFIYTAVLAVAAAVTRNRRAERLEGQLARAQVQALKMRVHPHFLFNALHAVTVLIKDSPGTAIEMVARLGDLLRASLGRATSPEVPLSSELDVLALYLAVEQVRFHDRLAVRYEIAPETRGAMIPDLLLQPIVENAVKHGFGFGRDGGTIVIGARREDNELVLDVTDNGRGWPEPAMASGLGLTLTRERLLALYGGGGIVDVSAQPQVGARVRIRMPFHTSPLR
jgi:LytS/YehU family sensor histidine kinase